MAAKMAGGKWTPGSHHYGDRSYGNISVWGVCFQGFLSFSEGKDEIDPLHLVYLKRKAERAFLDHPVR